jgi:hypothetical protein
LSKELGGDKAPALTLLELEINQLQEVYRTMDLKLRSWDLEQLLQNRESEWQPQQQSTLLYDGKTFDEWRTLWKTELKTENRTECIHALTAFGRAGYGNQAAEAILDVAGQYDYLRSGGTEQIQKLKNAALGALLDDGIPPEYWLPLLMERLEKEPRQWRSLASNVISDVHSAKPDVVAILMSVAKGPSHSSVVKGAALRALVRQEEWIQNEEIVPLVHEALAGTDLQLARVAVKALGFGNLSTFPEQFGLLFHEDTWLRNQVLGRLRYIHDPTSASLVLDKLLAMLDDAERSEDRVTALQAIYAMSLSQFNNNQALRKRKREVIGKLQVILTNGDNSLLPWTIKTLGSLTGSSPGIVIREALNQVPNQRRNELQVAAQAAEDIPPQSGGGFR